MISDRSEYHYNTVPETIRITGDIMPVRDLREDESWRELRGEDVFFTNEHLMDLTRTGGFGDLMTVEGETGGKPRMVSSAPFYEGVRNYIAAATNTTWAANGVILDPEYEFPTAPYWCVDDISGNTWYYLLPDAAYKKSFACDLSTFQSATPLYADSVRRLYYDLRGLTRVKVAHGDPDYTHLVYAHAGGSELSISGSTVYRYIPGDTKASAYVETWQQTGGWIYLPYGANVDGDRVTPNEIAFALLSIHYSGRANGTYASETHRYIVAFDVIKDPDGGVDLLPITDIKTIVDEAGASFFASYPRYVASTANRYTAFIKATITPYFMVTADLDSDRYKIPDDWQWIPS